MKRRRDAPLQAEPPLLRHLKPDRQINIAANSERAVRRSRRRLELRRKPQRGGAKSLPCWRFTLHRTAEIAVHLHPATQHSSARNSTLQRVSRIIALQHLRRRRAQPDWIADNIIDRRTCRRRNRECIGRGSRLTWRRFRNSGRAPRRQRHRHALGNVTRASVRQIERKPNTVRRTHAPDDRQFLARRRCHQSCIGLPWSETDHHPLRSRRQRRLRRERLNDKVRCALRRAWHDFAGQKSQYSEPNSADYQQPKQEAAHPGKTALMPRGLLSPFAFRNRGARLGTLLLRPRRGHSTRARRRRWRRCRGPRVRERHSRRRLLRRLISRRRISRRGRRKYIRRRCWRGGRRSARRSQCGEIVVEIGGLLVVTIWIPRTRHRRVARLNILVHLLRCVAVALRPGRVIFLPAPIEGFPFF